MRLRERDVDVCLFFSDQKYLMINRKIKLFTIEKKEDQRKYK
jgi:hypothetical protein